MGIDDIERRQKFNNFQFFKVVERKILRKSENKR